MKKIEIEKQPLFIRKIKRVIQTQNRNHHKNLPVEDRHSDAFVYILEGSCTYRFQDGQSFTVNEGDILYLAYRSDYIMYIHTENYRFIFCDFEFDGEDPRKSAVYTPEDSSDAENKFNKLLHAYRTLSPRSFSQWVCVLYEIYGMILQEENKPYRERDVRAKIESAKLYLEENYADPDFRVEFLAKQLDVSEVYFRRLFKEQYGISPVQYLTSVRLKNAKELMKYPFLSLEECALQSGFSSVQYFCRVFKKETNVTPAKFRNQK